MVNLKRSVQKLNEKDKLMNSKRIPLILIAVAFFLAVICSCFFIFAISKVEVEYSVNDTVDCDKIQGELDSFKGENILFVNVDSVYDIVDNYPSLKVESIEKKIPNVLAIKIVERIPVYKLIVRENVYLLDEEGYVIYDGQGEYLDKDLIGLSFDGLEVDTQIIVGDKLKVDRANEFENALLMAKSIELTDLIKEMKVTYLDAGEVRDVIFSTHQGVDIVITKADDNGIEKAKKAIESFDNCTNDFIKSFNRILVLTLDTGEIKVTWTKN